MKISCRTSPISRSNRQTRPASCFFRIKRSRRSLIDRLTCPGVQSTENDIAVRRMKVAACPSSIGNVSAVDWLTLVRTCVSNRRTRECSPIENSPRSYRRSFPNVDIVRTDLLHECAVSRTVRCSSMKANRLSSDFTEQSTNASQSMASRHTHTATRLSSIDATSQRERDGCYTIDRCQSMTSIDKQSTRCVIRRCLVRC
jgi:hypothetical protein